MYVHNSWLYLKPEHRDGYVERLLEEVRHAKKVEKTLLRFDVYQSLDDPSLIHTYEVFTDREAWEFQALIDVEPEHLEDYLSLITQHALYAKANEPGVDRFDVLQSLEDPNLIHTVEIYADKAAWTRYASQPYAVEFLNCAYVKQSEASGGMNREPTDAEWQ